MSERRSKKHLTGAARYRRGQSRYYYPGYGLYFGRVKRADGEILADIIESLARDNWASRDRIDVDVQDGKVTLTGEVTSAVEKRSAGDDAWETLGVVDVDNKLEIKTLR